MIGIQHFRNLGYSGFLVPDNMDLVQQIDQHFSKPLNPVSLESSQQHQRNRGKIDHPSDPDQPDCSGELLVNKVTIQEIQHQGNHRRHGLVCDKADGHCHGTVTDGYSGFPHGIDLHRLSAGRAGGNIAVIETDQGNVNSPADTDFESLPPQVEPVVHAVAYGIDQPAGKNAQQPDNIHLFDRVKGVGKILIAERDEKNSGDGESDKQKTQQFFES